MRSNVRKMSSNKIDTQCDVTDYRGKSDVILGIYISILGDDIFFTLEHIESNLPYYTTWIHSLKNIISTTLGCKDIGLRISTVWQILNSFA